MRIIHDYFVPYACEAQGFMGNAAKVRQVLAVLPEALGSVRDALERRWDGEAEEDEGCSERRWNTLSKHLASEGQVGESSRAEIMTQFCYPRLDINVSIGKY